MRLWWERHTGRPTETRAFNKMPSALILLHFYRTQARDLLRLEDLLKQRGGILLRLDIEDREELRRLRRLLREPEPKRSILGLLQSDEGVISDDPIWERYMRFAKAKSPTEIPDSWFGEGERGKKLKAKALKRAAKKASA